MATFKDIKSYLKAVQDVIDKCLLEDILPYAKEELYASIVNIVYAVGGLNIITPIEYERRWQGTITNTIGTGSLADTNEMKPTIENGVLTITNEADFKNNGNGGMSTSMSLSDNITLGYGSRSEWWNEARDYIFDASENLNMNHVKELLNKRLSKAGFGKIT